MRSITLGEIADITGGVLSGDASLTVTSIAIDSRDTTTESLFCAIVGARVDGHEFVQSALANGALASLVSKPVTGPHVLVPESGKDLDPVIVALGKLAAHQRDAMVSANVVGVTGSSGKTSTKDLIGQVLTHHGSTVVPTGSANNELGLPLTLLAAPADVQNLVLEMGMRGLGHIKYLCDIAKPTIAVVTNVGHAHIGEVGSQETIALAKSEIVRDLTATDVAVLNADDPFVRTMGEVTQAKVTTFGQSEQADIRAINVLVLPDGSSEFDIQVGSEQSHVKLQLLGQHSIYNALAATGVALAVGMPLTEVASALCSAKPVSDWRMQVSELADGVTVINDAYNANPESMAAALRTLAGVAQRGHSWAVLGTMAELGEFSVEQHDAIGRLAVRLDITHLVVVGEVAKVMHLGASQEGSWDGESVWFPDFASASDYIVEKVTPNDVLLFKASRSAHFEQLAEMVTARLAKGQGDATA